MFEFLEYYPVSSFKYLNFRFGPSTALTQLNFFGLSMSHRLCHIDYVVPVPFIVPITVIAAYNREGDKPALNFRQMIRIQNIKIQIIKIYR